jgi:hypothetical protein
MNAVIYALTRNSLLADYGESDAYCNMAIGSHYVRNGRGGGKRCYAFAGSPANKRFTR